MLTQAEVKNILNYCPSTGRFTWISCQSSKMKPGDIAGAIDSRGYRLLYIYGKRYYAHRIAWLLVYNKWPDCQIDHINGIKGDNSIDNLREANNAENKQNIKTSCKGKSGLLGVHKITNRERYTSKITTNGKTIYLGYFKSPNEAHKAYIKAKRIYHKYGTI